MRIIWNSTESRFDAELTPGELWRDDMDAVRSAGFKTTGAPNWIWNAHKASALNKLRSKPPKSGLTISELALEKYNFLNDQDTRKQELKKEFLRQKKLHDSRDTWAEYDDPETGLRCKIVAPAETKFVMEYVPPAAPDLSCFMCGAPLYLFDLDDTCLWCSTK